MTVTLFYDPKSPEDIAPYSLDFTQWLNPKTNTTVADSITTANVTVSGPDSVLTAAGSLVNGNIVTTVLSSGTAGKVYLVHFLITTAQSITVQRSVSLQVLER